MFRIQKLKYLTVFVTAMFTISTLIFPTIVYSGGLKFGIISVVKDRIDELKEKIQGPNTPEIPSGPSAGSVGILYTFTTSATDPNGDQVQYCFDLGDGSISEWTSLVDSGSSASKSYSYSNAGNYSIKVQAKNSRGINSEWSEGHTITITSNRVPNKPKTPSGPSKGLTGIAYIFNTSATDPDEDQVQYNFDWGDGDNFGYTAFVNSGSSANMSHTYSNSGNYYIKIQARDSNGAFSEWSEIHTITITSNQTPNVPEISSGPVTGLTGVSYTFSTSATDLDGDQVQYCFNWGDGNISDWTFFVDSGSSASMDYVYSSTGTYCLKAQARDNKGAVSGWSEGHTITIASRAPNKPEIPSGPATGLTGISYTFSTSATDPDGDQVQYCFNWDDGNTSDWTSLVDSGSSASMDYVYSSTGTYCLKAQARDSNGAVSGWSEGHTITIASRAPNKPEIPNGPATGLTGVSYTLSTSAIDPDGDKVQYCFNWGDGIISDWTSLVDSGSLAGMDYVYSSTGTYCIKAQARDSNGAVSEWSEGHTIIISSNQAPNKPETPSGPATGLTGGSYTFNTSATDPDGDQVQYCFNWDDGNTSDWTSLVDSGSLAGMDYVYSSTGTYCIKAQARDSNGAVSEWSDTISIDISAPDGSKKWEFETGGIIYSSPAIDLDGTIYVGSLDKKVYAINSNGTKKWEFATDNSIYSSPAIALDGTIYVGSLDKKVYAVDSNGLKKWEFETGGWVRSSPAIGSDGTIYVGSYDKKLYAINSNGIKKWEFETGGLVDSSPALGADGTIYVGCYDKKLYAIDSNGIKKWEFTTSGGIHSSPAIGSDGTIYIGSYDKKLYAINSNGTKKWEFETGAWIESSPVIDLDGTIYIGCSDKKLYSINSNGTKKWEFITDNSVSSVPLIGSDGTIYVGSNDNKLYAINSDGTKKWEFETGGVVYSSPAIGFDGTIYVGSSDTKLYAIKSLGILANTPWPMFRHDLRHTGSVVGEGENNPPNVPEIPSGPSIGLVGISYTFNTSAIDSNSDQVQYCFDWGDGIISEWTALVDSGISASKSHSYSSIGTYYIKAQARDSNSAVSDWSESYSICIIAEGTKGWEFETGGSVSSSPAIGSDGTIYVGSMDKKLYAINSDGTKKWEFETAGEVQSSPAIGIDGTIYVGSMDNKVYAINSDGTKKWEFQAGNSIYSSPAIGIDGTIYVGSGYFISDYSGFCINKIYAINSDGTKKWEFETGGSVSSSPAIASDGTIYVGSMDNKVYAINSDGTKKWKFETGCGVYASPAIGSDGTIYVGYGYTGSDSDYSISCYNKMFAINPDGTKRWEFETGGSLSSSPAIGLDGTIYVGSGDKKMYAINSDGTKRWEFETGGSVSSSPAIASDGTIYFGSNDKKMYAINSDGTKRWEFETGGSVSSSPAIGLDGTIYFGSNDNKVYAIYGSGNLANSSWPMFRHDINHTGRE